VVVVVVTEAPEPDDPEPEPGAATEPEPGAATEPEPKGKKFGAVSPEPALRVRWGVGPAKNACRAGSTTVKPLSFGACCEYP